MNRGVIQHRNRARQIVDFSGLKIGTITPTDIDGLIEYKNKLYLFFELKLIGVSLPYGQELALTRLIDSLNKPAILFVAEHATPANEDIAAAGCVILKYYYAKEWHEPKRVMTLHDGVFEFIHYIESKPI